MNFPKCTGNKHEFDKKSRKCIHCHMSRAQIRIYDDITFLEEVLNSSSSSETKDIILKPFFDKKPQYKGISELKGNENKGL